MLCRATQRKGVHSNLMTKYFQAPLYPLKLTNMIVKHGNKWEGGTMHASLNALTISFIAKKNFPPKSWWSTTCSGCVRELT